MDFKFILCFWTREHPMFLDLSTSNVMLFHCFNIQFSLIVASWLEFIFVFELVYFSDLNCYWSLTIFVTFQSSTFVQMFVQRLFRCLFNVCSDVCSAFVQMFVQRLFRCLFNVCSDVCSTFVQMFVQRLFRCLFNVCSDVCSTFVQMFVRRLFRCLFDVCLDVCSTFVQMFVQRLFRCLFNVCSDVCSTFVQMFVWRLFRSLFNVCSDVCSSAVRLHTRRGWSDPMLSGRHTFPHRGCATGHQQGRSQLVAGKEVGRGSNGSRRTHTLTRASGMADSLCGHW